MRNLRPAPRATASEGGQLAARPLLYFLGMNTRQNNRSSKFNLFLLIQVAVGLLVTGEPSLGMSRISATKTDKTYAVFVASFNSKTKEAIGGIAGTAFFISPTQALTALHVLQPNSFKPGQGYDQRQVWLIHEDEPAIELTSEDIQPKAGRDLTMITLNRRDVPHVNKRFIFQVSAATEKQSRSAPGVSTEGFLANSLGPKLAWDDQSKKIRIVEVKKLARLSLTGQLMDRKTVDLKAADVQLLSTPCLRVSYSPIVGMSGGPVVSETGQVVAVNSFADPSTRSTTWAVEIEANEFLPKKPI